LDITDAFFFPAEVPELFRVIGVLFMLGAVICASRVREPEVMTRITELKKIGSLDSSLEVYFEPAVRAAAHGRLH